MKVQYTQFESEAAAIADGDVLPRLPVPIGELVGQARKLACLFAEHYEPELHGGWGFSSVPGLVEAGIGGRLDALADALADVEAERMIHDDALETSRDAAWSSGVEALRRLKRELRAGLYASLEEVELRVLCKRHRRPKESRVALGRALVDFSALAGRCDAALARLPRYDARLAGVAAELGVELQRPREVCRWRRLRLRLATLAWRDMQRLRMAARYVYAEERPEVAVLFVNPYGRKAPKGRAPRPTARVLPELERAEERREARVLVMGAAGEPPPGLTLTAGPAPRGRGRSPCRPRGR